MNPPSSVPHFTEHLVWDGFTYGFGIQAFDVDGDGFVDITATDTDGFVQTEPFSGEPLPAAFAPRNRPAGGFTADGPRNSSIYWFKNDGQGGFTRRFLVKDDPGRRLERQIVADINHDGRPDLVVVDNFYGDILWFENPGPAATAKGQLWKKHYICKGNMPGAVDVAVGDFDGDGLLDVVCTGWRMGNCVKWFRNPGPGRDEEWASWILDSGFPTVQGVAVGDLDGDGRPDIVISSTTSRALIWYQNPGDPVHRPWARHVIDMPPGPREPVYLKLADLNRDGRPDLIVAWGGYALAGGSRQLGSVVWYENLGLIDDGRIRWRKHVVTDDLPAASYVEAADLNGDGWLEVVASGWMPGEVAWFGHGGDPSARWTKHALKTGWPNVNQLIVADLDRDGRPDIAGVADYGSMELRWWRNRG